MPWYSDLRRIGPPRWYGNYRTHKKLVVVHCTANTASAAAEAQYATRRTDSVSSHYYVDDQGVVQSLNTDLVAWHAGNRPGNQTGIAYEFTGRADWSRATWLANPTDINVAARQMARDSRQWRIPPRWLTVQQLKAGWAGFTTHDDVRRAWGGSHTDPGPGFPKDTLLQRVQAALNGEEEDMTVIYYVRKHGSEHVYKSNRLVRTYIPREDVEGSMDWDRKFGILKHNSSPNADPAGVYTTGDLSIHGVVIGPDPMADENPSSATGVDAGAADAGQ